MGSINDGGGCDLFWRVKETSRGRSIMMDEVEV